MVAGACMLWRSSALMCFAAPLVLTGMKKGVLIIPFLVVSMPVRAFPASWVILK